MVQPASRLDFTTWGLHDMTKKQNLSELDSATKMREEKTYKYVLFGSLKKKVGLRRDRNSTSGRESPI